MTIGEMLDILQGNNVPKSVTLMSNNGWECSPTDMERNKFELMALEEKIGSLGLENVSVVSDAQLGYIVLRESWWNALYKKGEKNA